MQAKRAMPFGVDLMRLCFDVASRRVRKSLAKGVECSLVGRVD